MDLRHIAVSAFFIPFLALPEGTFLTFGALSKIDQSFLGSETLRLTKPPSNFMQTVVISHANGVPFAMIMRIGHSCAALLSFAPYPMMKHLILVIF